VAGSRSALELGGVHAEVRRLRARRRKKAAPTSVWEDIDRALNPAHYRPRVLGGIEVAEFTRRSGERYTMIKTPRGPSYMRLSEEDRRVFDLIDGVRTVKEIVVEYFRRHGSFSLSAVADLVEELRASGFLEDPYLPVAELALEAHAVRRTRLPSWVRRFAVTRKLEIPGSGRFFASFYRRGGRFFFARPAALASAIVSGSGVVAFVVLLANHKYSLLGESAAVGVLVLYLVDLFTTFVHESGHALATIHTRRDVLGAGFMLYLGMPAFFIDTTDTWMADRRGRILATAAGPFAESVLGGAAALAAVFLPAGTFTTFCYQFAVLSYITVAENLIPFLRLDGYYILMDSIDVMNLRERAFDFVKSDLLGKLRQKQALTRQEKLFGAYGALAASFAILAVAFSVIFWTNIFRDAVQRAYESGWIPRILVTALLALILAPILRAAVRGARRAAARARLLVRRVRRTAERGWRREAAQIIAALPLARELPEEALTDIVEHVSMERFDRGRVIVRQGDRGNRFYVVRSGKLEVSRLDDDGAERVIRTLERGRSFGEIALVESATRTATVRAVEPSEVFALDKGTFDRVLAPLVEVAEEFRKDLLSAAELRGLAPFGGLDEADSARLLAGADWRTFNPGARIVKQGDEGDTFYVVGSGHVEVVQNRRVTGRLGPGAYFGETALLLDVPRTATVRAVTPVRVLELSRAAFDRVLAKSFRRGRLAPSRELVREWEH
jgi:putative peptide zinc metalloprotease protein